MKTCLAATISILISSASFAGELTYQPVNPNFGGNPNNGGFLLQQAQVNNHFKERQVPTVEKTSAQLLAENISNTVLTQLGSQVAEAIGNGDNSGSFTIGSSTVSFLNMGAYTQLTINDGQGGITQINIPNGV